MKKLLKIIFVLLLLLVVSASVFVYLFDANKYKQEIAELAESFAGRPISLAGDIKFSVYPWIGIQLQDVTIGNKQDTKAGDISSSFSKNDFATIERFGVSVKILPLLEKRLEIDKLILHRLAVDFEKNAAGANNWSDMFSDSGKSESGLNGLVIGGVEVTDSHLNWFDASTGKRYNLTSMNIITQAYVEGQALPLKLKAVVESNQPQWKASTSIETSLVFNPGSPIFKANDLKLLVESEFPLEGMESVNISLLTNGVINVKRKTAKLKDSDLKLLGLNISGDLNVDNIFSVPTIEGLIKVHEFEAAAPAKYFQFEMPEFENTNSLKNISLTSKFKTDFNSVSLNEISARIDKSKLKGFVKIQQLNHDTPVVRYDLDVDKIDWKNYAVKTKALAKETMLPLDFIRGVDLQGSVDVAELLINELPVTSLHIPLALRKSILVANPISMVINKAKIRAAMELNSIAVPFARATIKVSDLNAKDSINPLLSRIMGQKPLVFEGYVNVSSKLRSKGESFKLHRQTLSGTLKLDMDKPVLKGIDLNHAAKKVVSDYANRNNFRTRSSYLPAYDPASQIAFNHLNATIIVSGKKLSTTDLSLVSDQVNLAGAGAVDFDKGLVSYRSIVDKHVKDRVDIRDKLLDHPMEYDVKGKFENLTTQFDLAKYDLLAGRLLHIEAKARRIRAINNQRNNSW